MAFDNRDSIDFGNNEIPQLFRSIFVPTLFGMMFNVAFILTDGIFVGHGIGPEGLASINLVAPIMMLITSLGMMFGVGASVVAAIHLAKENRKAARINVTQAYYACIVLAVILGIFFYVFPRFVLKILGVSDTLMSITLEYYRWFIPTALFLMFQIVGEFVIRLDGSPKYAMFANIIPAVVNIILDFVFIFPCHMALKGAALATDIGTGIGALMALYYMLFKAENLKFYRLKHTLTSLRLTLRNIGYMIKLGFSAFIGELAVSIMMLAGNVAFGRMLGDDGIAAYSVICYLFPVVYMIYNAVAQSAQPIISYNHGAGLVKRVRQTFRHSILISLIFGAAMTTIFVLMPRLIIGIFLQVDSAPFLIASQGLPIYSLGFVIVAFNISVIGYYQSVERAGFSTLLMLLRGILLLIPSFLFLPQFLGVLGLWLAVPISELLTAITALAKIGNAKKSQQTLE